MKVLYKLLVFCLCLIPLQLGFAQFIVVDINGTGNFTTIQAAIDHAVNGDTVLVLPGTYFENINFKGKVITIASQYWADGDTNHINNTIINGSRPTNPDSGSTVYFVSGEDTNSVLTGFTITGGKGTKVISGIYNDMDGGGIFIWNSGAKIEKNKITNNHIATDGDIYAGGAGICGLSRMRNLVIRGNEISNNSATVSGSTQAFSTAIVTTEATCIFENNYIHSNILSAPNGSAFAAGLMIDGWDLQVGNYIVRNNIIRNNKFNTNNGGGGGVVIQNCSPIFSNNIIFGNEATLWGGGGIWVVHYRFAANVVAPNPLLINNTIINNSTTGIGSGILVSGTESNAVVRNIILWGNSGVPIATESGASIKVRYSDVQGGYNGVGNIDADPVFVNSGNGDFQLQAGSPCIDAGDPNSPLDPDGTRADIGAKFYYHLDAPYVWKTDEKIDDSNGNNNGRPDAGETAKISITLINTSLDATGVTAKLVSDDPGIQIVQGTSTFGNMVRNQVANNENNPFEIAVKPGIDSHFTKFYINITADGSYANTDNMTIMVGTPQLLVVDDDNQGDYENYFIQPLNEKEIYPEHWEISAKGAPAKELMKQYKAVIWFTGDDDETALSAEEQTTIADYLDNGGKLLITGQNLGDDLVKNGSASDSAFYANYLHAKLVADSTKPTTIVGISGDPITNGLFLNFSGGYGGAGNQSTPDIISAGPGANIILKYVPGMGGAALSHENPVTNSRLVYLAFGFEGIAGPYEDSAEKLIINVLSWLQGTTDVEQIPDSRLPKEFALEQNYPNPFNPATTITYAVAKNSHVKLTVYNTLGQVVTVLVDGIKSQGCYEVNWNADNQPSGLYFYRLETDGFTATKKMLLQK